MVNDFERVEMMIAIREGTRTKTIVARVTAIAMMAAAASIMLSATAATVRLVGVTSQGDAVLIESSEPAAYSVSRPDPLTLVVDMRNVSVGEARSEVARQGAIAGVRLELATAVDGRSVARVHVALVRPVGADSKRAADDPPRVDAARARGLESASATTAATLPCPNPRRRHPRRRAGGAPNRHREEGDTDGDAPRAHPHQQDGGSDDGHARRQRASDAPGVSEQDRPRRLVLDFPSVTAKTPAITAVDSPLVTRVRVGVNSVQPLVTRVVMEVAPTAKYHVERSGDGGRDLDVVFESTGTAAAPVMMSPAEPSAPAVEPEPPVTLQQAIANVAAITPPENIADPITALDTVGRSAGEPPLSVEAGRTPTPAARTNAAAPSSPAPAAPSAPTSSTPARPAMPPAARPAAAAFVTVPATTQPAPAPAAPAPLQTRAPQASAQPAAQAQAQPPPPQPPPPQPPPAPPTAPQASPRPGEPQRQFTGHPISMDFEGVDLRAVLRTFADVSGLNMVIDADVQGTVDIKLTDVPWDQALDVILRGNQLDYSVDGTIVRISRIKTIEEENKARVAASQAAAERQAQAGGLTFETFPLSYAKAAETAPLLRGSLRMSKYGQVQVDVRTNTLIVADLPDQLPAIGSCCGRSIGPSRSKSKRASCRRPAIFARARRPVGLNGRVMPTSATRRTRVPEPWHCRRPAGTQSPTDPRASELETTATGVRLGVPTPAAPLAWRSAVNGAFNPTSHSPL